jgi:hypothetical protein
MNEKIKSKIKKLLALSESPNQAEAELALEKAGELMIQHNINLSDIDKKESEVVKKTLNYPNARAKWKWMLFGYIARFYGCESLVSRDKKTYIIVGRNVNIEIVLSMFDYIVDSFNSAWKRRPYHMHKNSFYIGMTKGIFRKIGNIKRERSGSNCENYAIVAVSTEKENSEYLKKELGNPGEVKTKKSTVCGDSMDAGHAAAKNISLSNQVS